jgi:TPP-dependent indolepyruvate ferredoxin oxidoreductase alpha subunit
MLDQPAAQLPETCANEASAAALLGASINYPFRGCVTWKSIVGTNVGADPEERARSRRSLRGCSAPLEWRALSP